MTLTVWSVGESGGRTSWVVSGANGENLIKAEGRTQAEAWYRATLQAGACGILAKSRSTTIRF